MTGIVTGGSTIPGRGNRSYQDMRGAKRPTPGRHEWRRFHASATGQTGDGVTINVEWDGGDRYTKSGSYFTHSQASNQHLITINSAGEYLVLVRLRWHWAATGAIASILDTKITGALVTNGNAPLGGGACNDQVWFNLAGPHLIGGSQYHHINATAEDDKLMVLHTIIDRDTDLTNDELYVRCVIAAASGGNISLLDSESSITIIKLGRYWRI
jgi:hypothetical protein